MDFYFTLIAFFLCAISTTLSIIFSLKIKIGKMHLSLYWIFALFFAILILIFTSVSLKDIGSILFSNTKSNPLKILALFLSMTFLSLFLDEMGFFKFVANKATSQIHGNQFALFIIVYFLVGILTVFTSNDIVILTFTPFICCLAKNTKINPIPYLVAEFVAANTYSMTLLIGNPTNIYIGISADINFIEYAKVMIIPTLCAGLIQLAVLILLFYKQLKTRINDYEIEQVELNKLNTVFGVCVLGACIIFLVISNYINLEMYLICLIFFVVLSLFILARDLKSKTHVEFNVLKRVPWQVIPFILSMFVIVFSLQKVGITEKIINFLSNKNDAQIYGWTSYFACNLINNIPMSILYSGLVVGKESIYASIIGSNIGAFLTPVGALAGIMFTDLLKQYNVEFSFKKFSLFGLMVSVPTLLVALLMMPLFL